MILRLWHVLFGHPYGEWFSGEENHIRMCRCGEAQAVHVSDIEQWMGQR